MTSLENFRSHRWKEELHRQCAKYKRAVVVIVEIREMLDRPTEVCVGFTVISYSLLLLALTGNFSDLIS